MEVTELVTNIVEGLEHPLKLCLEYWLPREPRFHQFVEYNHSKIKRKVRGARHNYFDLEDVRYELEMSVMLLADQRFEVYYERYAAEPGRSPDLSARFNSEFDFNVEVKHLREAALGQRYDDWCDEFHRRAQQELPPGFLGIFRLSNYNAQPGDLLVTEAAFLDKLEASTKKLLNFVEECMREYVERGRASNQVYPVPEFGRSVELILLRTTESPDAPTSFPSRMKPRFYKGNEELKICELICSNLSQMRAGMANVLAIRTTATTYDKGHVLEALELMGKLAASGEDDFFRKKGCGSAQKYIELMANLSAIWFRSIHFLAQGKYVDESQRTLLWVNPDARVQLLPAVIDSFEQLPVPYPSER